MPSKRLLTSALRSLPWPGGLCWHRPAAAEAHNTPACTYGHKLAAAEALARLHPGVLRAMRLPSRDHRV